MYSLQSYVRQALLTTLVVVSLGASVSFSADGKRARDAFQNGDYAIALREWTPLVSCSIPQFSVIL